LRQHYTSKALFSTTALTVKRLWQIYLSGVSPRLSGILWHASNPWLEEILMARTFARTLLLVLAALVTGCGLTACSSVSDAVPASASEDYLFCFWNVENLFDERRP
jgi:hypothetical protein